MNVSKLRIGEICYSKDLNTEHICDMEKTCSPQAGRGVKVSERCLVKKIRGLFKSSRDEDQNMSQLLDMDPR